MEVGDLVYFRDDLIVGENYGIVTWRRGMDKRISGVITYYDKWDDTFMIEGDTYWYSNEMVEKVDGRMSLIENQRELKRLEEELKLHRDEFKKEISELKAMRDKLKVENEQLRLEALDMNEDELEDGVSVSYRNDFEVDMTELDDDYILMVPDEKRIREELVASEWTKPINGVTVVKKSTVRVSLI